jgi:histidyl-tRNA synthetase
MIGRFSGQQTPASGFSIGFERIITILKDKMSETMSIDRDNVAILVAKGVPSEKKLEIFNEAKALREQGKTVTVQPMKKNVKQQISMLEAEGYSEFKKIYND